MNQQSAQDLDELVNPYPVQATQEWFAGIITSPLIDNNINPRTPSGFFVAEEAGKYVVPSPTLAPHMRMQIYNQQYWWRLLKALHENFPFLTRLFGYYSFNETIAVPFLVTYPPNHWSLNILGERIPKWIEESYHAPDKGLVLQAAELDWAFISSFVEAQKPKLNLSLLTDGNPEDNLLQQVFFLQPHIHLFKWDCDLMRFRESFLQKDVDYWTENDFPELQKGKTFHYILFRSLKTNNIHWKEISQGEYLLLSLFKVGSTIEAACESLEHQEAVVYEEATKHLQEWLQEWVQRSWLCLKE